MPLEEIMNKRFLPVSFFCLLLAASASGYIGTGVAWNTFQGTSAGSVYGNAVATDALGYVYVAGSSFATWGAPVAPFQSFIDAYVAKFTPWGGLVWNTFLGGNGRDVAKGIAVDGDGNVYVIGLSASSWGAPVRPFSGSESVFVAKLNGLGQLTWHTFLNGAGSSEGAGITVDSKGNAFVCGTSYDKWGTPVNRFAGSGAFVAKLGANGALKWNTFAPAGSYGLGIALQGGNILLAGYSDRGWAGALKRYAGGWDAYVLKLNSLGVRQWSTFIGSASEDMATGLATDSGGNIYLAGTSKGTWGAPVRPFAGGGSDAFVAKLSPGGLRKWNTFLGSSDSDQAAAVAISGAGNVYVSGQSNASWGTPFRPYTGPATTDAFAAKLDPAGTLLWNGFLGGAGFSTAGNGISASPRGDIVVAGTGYGSWGTPVDPFTGSWGNAYAASIQEPGIAVFGPAANESVSRGVYITVAWTSLIPHSEVAIDLMKGNVVVLPIAATTDNDGDFMWQIPPGFLPGTGFRIRVRTLDGAYEALGPVFSINKGSFYFFSPNGGTSWARRTTQTISWDISGNPGPSVRLFLLDKNGRYLSTIRNLAENDGSFDWPIPGTLAPGSYMIKILIPDRTVSAMSELFTIY
jgi:hypothetical protein